MEIVVAPTVSVSERSASRAFQKECAHKCEHVVLGDGGNCGGKGKPFEDRIDEEVVE